MVLVLDLSERSNWFHVDFRPVIGGRLNASRGTGVYNGDKHHKWYTDG